MVSHNEPIVWAKKAGCSTGRILAATFYRSLTNEEHGGLQALFDSILANSESAYEEGLSRGKDLLLSPLSRLAKSV